MGIMQRINTNTVVYNYLELKDSLENTTDTFIYLVSDITFTNGIKINASNYRTITFYYYGVLVTLSITRYLKIIIILFS